MLERLKRIFKPKDRRAVEVAGRQPDSRQQVYIDKELLPPRIAERLVARPRPGGAHLT